MKIPIYQVDAFTDKLFGGNPAAVCPLKKWLDEKTMQSIALENNFAETAFIVKEKNAYNIRWFTPKVEVKLCGHATLATSFVIFNFLKYKKNEIIFNSKSGELRVRKENGLLILNFPSDKAKKTNLLPTVGIGIGILPAETYKGKTDYMLVYDSQEQIENISPDFKKLSEEEVRGIIVTSPGKDCDFVSRFFAPAAGVNEDPVTGSAHTTLIPYWSKRLKKIEMTARQLSDRKGFLRCKFLNERVEIGGKAVLFLKGEIEINSK